MTAIAEARGTIDFIEVATPEQAPIITTLFDLMATLQEQVEPEEDNLVTAAVVDLLNNGYLHFLNIPDDASALCA